MSLLSNTTVLLGKELRTEFRSRELLTTTIVFVLIVIVLFRVNLDATTEESRHFGPGLLWLAFLFTASLMLQPCFVREQNNDTLSSLRLSVSDPFAIFLSKLCANTLFLLLTELLLLPIFAVLYNIPTEATAALLSENPVLRWDWVAVLLVFDIIFLTAVWLFGEYLLEE
jgi:heme exporter protein B